MAKLLLDCLYLFSEDIEETSSQVPWTTFAVAQRQSVIISGQNAPVTKSAASRAAGKRKATDEATASTSSVSESTGKRKFTDEATASASQPRKWNRSVIYAQREAISLQHAEHEMQMKLLRTKLENCQEKHTVKMDILNLKKKGLEHQRGYRDSNNNASSQSCSSNQNVLWYQ